MMRINDGHENDNNRHGTSFIVELFQNSLATQSLISKGYSDSSSVKLSKDNGSNRADTGDIVELLQIELILFIPQFVILVGVCVVDQIQLHPHCAEYRYKANEMVGI